MYNLSKEEKLYLKKIAISVRNNYLRKNKYTDIEKIEEMNEETLVSKENIEINFEIKCDYLIMPNQIEKVFENPEIMKKVKVLTPKEKLVLFLYYFENETDENISKKLNMKKITVSQTRIRALAKIRKNVIGKEEEKNV